MNIEALTEEIELIAETGDAADAVDLSQRLIRDGDKQWAIAVRRTVSRDSLDRAALREAGRQFAETVARSRAEADRILRAAARMAAGDPSPLGTAITGLLRDYA